MNNKKVDKDLDKVNGGRGGSRRSPQGKTCFTGAAAMGVDGADCARFKIHCSDYDLCRNRYKEKH